MRKSSGQWIILLGILLGISLGVVAGPVGACTTGIFTGASTRDGLPLLWKNRDTDTWSNKVLFVREQPHAYLAIVNAEDTSGRWVWGGVNDAGFAIENSVAYNLPSEDGEMKDLEGLIMSEALRTCRTIEDFEEALRRNLGSNLGAGANFGVVDASGRGALFETHNHGYKRFDAGDAPEKYLVVSNFSRSGASGKGAGYIRFERASALFKKAGSGRIDAGIIIDVVGKDFGHGLVEHPAVSDLKRLDARKSVYVCTRDTINRCATSATMVVQGGRAGRPATMWVRLGEPLCSVAVPLWVEAGESPKALSGGKEAPIYVEARRLQKLLRPWSEMDRVEYMDVTRLDNRQGTGFLPVLEKAQREIEEETAAFLRATRGAGELRDFQERMAEKALEAMRRAGKG